MAPSKLLSSLRIQIRAHILIPSTTRFDFVSSQNPHDHLRNQVPRKSDPRSKASEFDRELELRRKERGIFFRPVRAAGPAGALRPCVFLGFAGDLKVWVEQ